MNTIDIIISILIGICILLPLVIKGIKVLRNMENKKQWNLLINLISKFCIEAEELFSIGA